MRPPRVLHSSGPQRRPASDRLIACTVRGARAITAGLCPFVVETALLSLPLPDWFSDTAAQLLLTSNALALSTTFGATSVGPGMAAGTEVTAGQAGRILAGYTAAFTTAALAVIRRRAVV